MTQDLSEQERLKVEYDRRSIDLVNSFKYSSFNMQYLFTIQQRQRATIQLLVQSGIKTLDNASILELGSGRGDLVQEFLFHRLKASQVHAIELLWNRLQESHQRFPGVNFIAANGQKLPYADAQFDLVIQSTMFSSILDDEIKQEIASEMLRVLKKDTGAILWYDFWLNPSNSQTKGIGLAEIKKLFPNAHFRVKRTTLAPPISRFIVPKSWLLAALLENLTLFNTHYLVHIQPKSAEG